MTVAEAIHLATQCHQAGRLAEAEKLYRQVLSVAPQQPEALHFMGVLAHQTGKFDVAVQLMSRSVAIQPNASWYSNLGLALREMGKIEDSLAAHRRAVELDPLAALSWSNMALALRSARKYDESEAACRRAVELDPNLAGGWQNWCNALGDLGKTAEAVDAGKRAAELNPGNATVWADLGSAYVEHGDLRGAVGAFEKSIAIDPNGADAHHNLAQALLAMGEFERGWTEYEWRWKSAAFPSPKRDFQRPQWGGEKIEGKTLLIHGEQGFGDSIQFARYVPMIATKSAARVVVEVQEEVLAIVRTVPGPMDFVARGQALPAFDYHCPMLSLPLAMKTRLETIPHEVAYITVDAERAGKWKARVGQLPAGLKVGIVWAGRSTHANDHNRTVALERFAPLAMEGVTLVSLQKGPAAGEIEMMAGKMTVPDWGRELADFSETAALIANLDLVIAVDTSVVHLAGAIGKEVWVLVPFASDWRWIKGREDSPWYPTMRLFRQKEPRGWEEVFDRVAAELSRLRR